MAFAMIQGFLRQKKFPPSQIFAFDLDVNTHGYIVFWEFALHTFVGRLKQEGVQLVESPPFHFCMFI